MHSDSHPLAGRTVLLAPGVTDPARGLVTGGRPFQVEDWWDHLTSRSWMEAGNNPAALQYAIRSGMAHLPIDDDVIYGKIDECGHLVHASELSDASIAGD